jgi:predicted PurR-regulated permease PerM
MTHGSGTRIMVGLIAAVVVAAALQAGQAVFGPLVFSLFVIAMVWPVQRAAQQKLPQGIALVVTVLVTVITVGVLALSIAWAFGRVAEWVVANGDRLQRLYLSKLEWLELRGFDSGSLLAGQFDMRWIVGLAQGLLGQVQITLTFALVTSVYVILGLLEVEQVAAQLARMKDRPAAQRVLRGLERSAAKLRSYMLVRSLVSVLTGVMVYAFARGMGLDLAVEWGVIGFVLNYIPFIGPLIATVFPAVVALLQFESWQAVVFIVVGLQVIQFLLGSYLEPRLTGKQLAVSPFMVLVAVFLGGFLWGIPGAFIGVPVLIAALTLCEEFEGSRWVATLLSGRDPDDA